MSYDIHGLLNLNKPHIIEPTAFLAELCPPGCTLRHSFPLAWCQANIHQDDWRLEFFVPAPPMIPLADCLYCPLLTEKGEGGGVYGYV